MPTHPGLDQVKELLSNGETERAADLLLTLAKEAGEVYYRSALMLKNQLEQLQHDVIDGIVSDSDERLNWAKISKRIIELTRQIEKKEAPKEEVEMPPSQNQPKPVPIFPKWVLWALPVLILGGIFLVPDLIKSNNKNNEKTADTKTELPHMPQNSAAKKVTMTGKLVFHRSKAPVAGAILDFNAGAFTATTQHDGTFTITFDEALKGKSGIPLIIRYDGKKMVEEVWLSESRLNSLMWRQE